MTSRTVMLVLKDHTSAMALVERLQGGVERRAPSAKRRVRIVHRDLAKRDPLARLELTNTSDVERADGGDLRVSARRLPVHQQHDRLSVAHHLDAAKRDAVGDDVVSARVLDPRPPQPRAHAIALRRHLVGAFEETGDAAIGEPVVLRAAHDANFGLTGVVGDSVVAYSSWPS